MPSYSNIRTLITTLFGTIIVIRTIIFIGTISATIRGTYPP